MKNKILTIGITGGIGTGKTLVTKIFSILGIPVYNADGRARWLMINKPSLIECIKKTFGKDSYIKEHVLNTAFLSSKVFNDVHNLNLLNELVHPEVAADFEEWLNGKKAFPYIIKEAALLFEAGSYKSLDKIITVSAPMNIRMQRILERDPQRSEKDILAIMNKQMPEEEKIKKADYVIKNDSMTMVIPQVLKLHEKFLSE